MAKTFPNTPYYDDYNEDKQFQTILFKPGKAVQARELTQIQTLAQKQIERFGNHVFKNGSIVTDCAFALDLKLPYVKIQDADTSANDVDVTDIEVGYTLTGVSSGVTGYVITTADGVETSANTKTIFFKYTSANETVKTFSDGEQIQVRDGSGNLVLTVLALASSSTGFGSSFTLGDGVIYVDGSFLKHLSQTIILDRYSTTPSYKLGIVLTESIVTSDADESLLDPALGSSNYFATGADRYKVVTTLTKKTLTDTELTNFFLLYEVVDGQERRALDKAQYNILQDELAKRTFEESGDYTVKPFTTRIREHLNTGTNGGLYTANAATSGNVSLLAVGVEPGIAYVRGYRVENLLTEYLSIEKGIEIASEEAQPIAFGYGNYININEVSGPWDVDNSVQVSLRNAVAQSITNETYGSTSAPGSQIGTARVKSVLYNSGNVGLSDGTYRLYLYDINMTSSTPFANVKSIYYNAGSGSDSFGDVVLTNGVAQLQESNFNIGVFRFPQRAMKRLRATDGSLDNSFEFKKSFDVTIATNGTFSVTSPVANEVFPFGAGALNATQKQDNFVLVLNQAAETTNLTGTVSTSTTANLVTGGSTTFATTFKPGDRFKVGANSYRVANVVSDTQLYITDSVGAATVSGQNYTKVFALGEYIDLTESGSSGTTRTVTISSDTQADIDVEETFGATVSAKILVNLQKTDGQEIQKNLRKNRYVKIDCTSDTSGTYNLGFSDVYRIVGIYHGTDYSESNTNVTNQFNLDNGQRDTHYTHGKIVKKAGSTLSLTSSSRLLVKLDYFNHDTSSGVGFLSVDSYPVDDTETIANTIRTENIPVYVSPVSGQTFDLRDCIDIRPRYTDTSSDATSIGSASINPAAASAINVPSGGLRVAAPNEEFNTDLEYYLARKDMLYINKAGQFGIQTGLSEIAPITPNTPQESLAIAEIFVPPYPSLAPQAARASGRYDYSTSIKAIDTKRFTMTQIGAISQRINRLEYYAALNFLEGEAKNKVIASDVTGLDRFKNGFLVDNFSGHSIGNVNDTNYKCAIDPVLGELRPIFKIDNIDLEFNSSESSNVYRAPKDAEVNITNLSGSMVPGQTLTQGSVTGYIQHVVGSKLYLINTTGTFTTGPVTTANGSATISSVEVPAEGDLITLPYTHTVFARNEFATKPRNCVGELLFYWVGEMELNPPADNWTDTTVNPDLIVNFDNNLDNWLALDEAWGTQWGDWRTNWTGTDTTTQVLGSSTSFVDSEWTGEARTRQVFQTDTVLEVTTITERQSRSGTNLNVVPETVNYDLGNRVVDVSIVPFIRQQIVTFTASRMKPNTRVYAFFDGENVSQYCRPVNGSLLFTSRYGDAMTTDSNGNLIGHFRIPNNDAQRFRIGQRLFKLVDDEQDRLGFSTTSASETFTAFGISQTQERTILSSRQARVGFTTESQRRTVTTSSAQVTETDARLVDEFYFDPIAQTFIVENNDGNGIFISKLELFFRTKDANLPITLQIRETVNGFPGPRILPFGSVTLYPDKVNISEDASAPTVFTFPSPIFLQDGIEYCFVLIPAGNNPNYNIWVSELGENQLGTTNRVSKQPYVGILFTSANNRAWTPVQAEDIKFTMYRAAFNTGSTGTVVLNNDDCDYLYVTNLTNGVLEAGDPIIYSSGTGNVKSYDSINQVVTVIKDSTSARIRSNVYGTGYINATSASNVVTGVGTLFNTEAYANAVIYDANTNTRIGKIVNIVDDGNVWLDALPAENVTANSFIMYDEIRQTSNATGEANVYCTVETINEKYINLFHTNLSMLSFVPTTISSQYKIRNSTANTISSYSDFIVNQDLYVTSEAKVSSNSTEDALFSNTKSFATKLTMSTTSQFVSPALDTAKMSSIIVHNQVNNDFTNETTNSGNALSRYISKVVTLDEGQDAEDLKVYLTAYKPPNTNIKVYARLLNGTDNTPFGELNYIEMEQVTSTIVQSSSSATSDYKEFEFKLPDSVLTGAEGEVQYTVGSATFTGFKRFAIKIVLLSTDTAIVPKVKDYRAIALQI